jgi:hypothetical protein
MVEAPRKDARKRGAAEKLYIQINLHPHYCPGRKAAFCSKKLLVHIKKSHTFKGMGFFIQGSMARQGKNAHAGQSNAL